YSSEPPDGGEILAAAGGRTAEGRRGNPPTSLFELICRGLLQIQRTIREPSGADLLPDQCAAIPGFLAVSIASGYVSSAASVVRPARLRGRAVVLLFDQARHLDVLGTRSRFGFCGDVSRDLSGRRAHLERCARCPTGG